jgi:hypothetical protein
MPAKTRPRLFFSVASRSAYAALALCALSFSAGAEERRQADAHVHGQAELSMALDGEVLQVELHSPLANLTGFEHSPETDEERAKLATAKETLKDGDALFSFAGGNCVLKEAALSDLSFEKLGDMEEGHDAHHDEHDHDKDHDHDAHDHEAHHDAGEAHAEIRAAYTFTCAAPADIAGFETRLFSLFSGFEKIEAVFLSADRQAAEILNPARPGWEFE